MMLLFGEQLSYQYQKGITPVLTPCPGFYCGRTLLSNGSFSKCGPCPRGYRRFDTFECVPCESDLLFYDWLYLGFMGILPILFHLFWIDRRKLGAKDTVGLVICALVEVILSATTTMLIWEPRWTFQIKACGVSHLSDWYPIFYNPYPNYDETLYCSHEVVYPLYTFILVFYGLADIIMLIIRFIAYLAGFKVLRSIYTGLYFYPMLALCHLVCGGIIYAIFPYSIIIGSVISCAYHFAKREDQDMKSLISDSIKDWRNAGIILCHWFLHAYGIVSVTLLNEPVRDFTLLALVPAPSILYIATVSWTDPTKLHGD